jgi:proteasome component ECM29
MTVIKIAKAGGKALSPFIELLVPQLLGLLSTIEPEQLNYQYQRMGEAHREKLDKLRSQMINQSPIMEAIENALRNLDKDSMPALTAALEETAKTALGMPTKLGTARVLTVLATSHSNSTMFGTQAARFLKLMEKLILERNDEVSQAYAASAAYILRAAPSAAQLKYANRLGELYFAAEDEKRREKVAYAVTALSKISPDHFATLEASLLPLAYFASHDEDEYVSHAMGGEVWEKHAGASARGVRRFATEIVSLVEKALDKNVWALKHAGALTAAGVVGAASNSADGLMAADVKSLRATWPVYERALALKTFPRKDELLEVLPGFADAVLGQSAGRDGANGKADDSITENTLHKIVVREAKRNNEIYKPHAFKCLWRFARGRESHDMWDEVVSIVTPSLESLKEKADEMDVDSKSGKDSKAAEKERSAKKERENSVNKAAEAAVEAIAKAFPPERLGASDSGPPLLAKIVVVLKPFLSAEGFSIIKRKTWYGCVEEIFNEAAKSHESNDGTDKTGATGTAAATVTPLDRTTMEAYVESLDLGSAFSGTEDQRTTRVKAVMALVKAVKAGLFGKGVIDLLASLKKDVDNALETERAMDVRKLWKDVLLETRE